ncbi:regulator of ribonuclease activity A [Loktanella atrilutea]|uniref:4-hydroxy-4-methyl-2-oxoglutarate aldolase n=1 Tax=Loktanella atrilutea TaxID=366533 RepID=A0A1M4U470_LOKAT|nr:ribonuclease E activity regulator RraA [Loktanella atrilutea]SHE51475.1 regulator of ribonuclease activity A [Loktanella atrilutea]
MTLPPQPDIVTADLYDLHHETVAVIDLPLRAFGGLRSFFGPCQTLQVHRDHTPVLAQLDQAGDGRVLVVDAGGITDTGVMGDRLAERGVRNGWRGVVIRGAIRDSRGIAALPLGVMALSATPRRGWTPQPSQAGTALTLGGAAVLPGHWIYADCDGVIVSPHALA